MAHFAAQAIDGGANGRGVVGKVVVNGHATGFAAPLQAAAHVLEFGQGGGALLWADAHVLGCGHGRQRIELVVLAQHVPFHPGDLQRAPEHIKGMRLTARAQGAGLFLAGTEAHHVAPAAALQHTLQALLAGIDH